MTRRRILTVIIVTVVMMAAITAAASASSYSPYKTGKVISEVNIRAAASTSADVKGTLKVGEIITLKGYTNAEDKKWYRITYSGSKAYVWADNVKKIKAYSYTIYTPKKYGKVTAEPYLNVRSGASADAKVIGKLVTGKKIILKGYKGDWYRITYNGKAGYVSKDWVKRITKAEYSKSTKKSAYTKYSSNKYGKVTASEGVNVRTKASTKAEIVSSLGKGSKIILKGYKYNGKTKWYRMYYSGTYGYICAKYVDKISKSAYGKVSTGAYNDYNPDQYGKVTADPALYVRKKASTSAKKLGSLDYGTKKILYGYIRDDNDDKWYKIKYNGEYGYICGEYVKKIDKTEYEKKSSAKPVETPATGNEIVDYAFKYKGVPYVWAGASPKGFDCSGFVMYVFGHFGVSLPHSSWDIEKYGKGVSYDNAKPGDVICYGEHVGIYIGNGQIIHASSSAGCVAVGTATYKSIRTVRRISH